MRKILVVDLFVRARKSTANIEVLVGYIVRDKAEKMCSYC